MSVLKERRQLRVLTIVSIVLACGATVLGLTVRAQFVEFESSRASAKVAACESYNADVVDKVNGILISVAKNSKNPTAAAAAVKPLFMAHRLCTPEGIAAYYDGDDLTDPFVKETP